MSAIAYPEPYKLPAGMLALAVHGAFFALLYFGVSWRADPPQGMAVDIWDSLPEVKSAPAKLAPPEAVQPEPPKPVEPPKLEAPQKLAEPAQPAVPPKADIELAEKKKPKVKPAEIKKAAEPKKPPVKQNPPTEQKSTEPKISEAQKTQQAAQAEQERARAEQAAAIGRVVDEHKARIVAKIRRNIVMPPDVPDNARAEFEVTLLPGGSVLSAKLTRPSGKEAYDSAVERAIFKAQPLPLPPDVALFNKFRELHLIFSPKE